MHGFDFNRLALPDFSRIPGFIHLCGSIHLASSAGGEAKGARAVARARVEPEHEAAEEDAAYSGAGGSTHAQGQRKVVLHQEEVLQIKTGCPGLQHGCSRGNLL